MTATKREHTLGIWALTLGYFLFYVPYSGMSKAATSGLLTRGQLVSGPELLPVAGIATAISVLSFITGMRWWMYGRKRRFLGMNVVFPRQQTFISGVGFAIIIFTTTLAYSFRSVSILLALVLMRAGVLIMSPVIDWVFGRRVRWFSWIGLGLSLAALAISFLSIREYHLAVLTLINLAAYLLGHALRIPSMTRIAKTGNPATALGYFVEEQAVAMGLLICIPLVVALFGGNEIALQLRTGFAQFFTGAVGLSGLLIGLFYAGLGICLSFIYLDRRENTFCMPLYACSSLLAGVAASYLLTRWMHAPNPNGIEMFSASLIIAALVVMSPLHHLPLYIKQLKVAIAERRLILVNFRPDSQASLQHTSPLAINFITIDFQAIRNLLQTRNDSETPRQ